VLVQLVIKLITDSSCTKPALYTATSLACGTRQAGGIEGQHKSIFSSRNAISDSWVRGTAEHSCGQKQPLLARLAINVFLHVFQNPLQNLTQHLEEKQALGKRQF